MRIVGLTGGIATGKSTVSKEFARRGLPVVDADKVAHDAAKQGTVGYGRIIKAFGTTILQENGEIDRMILGDLVFNDPVQRKKLNQVLQLPIAAGLLQQLAYHWMIGTPVVVLDAPLLFETKLNVFCKPILVISCSPHVQEARLMERNLFTRDQAKARIQSQLPLEWKCSHANLLIDNSGTLQELWSQYDHLVSILTTPPSWCELIFSRGGALVVVGVIVGFILSQQLSSFYL